MIEKLPSAAEADAEIAELAARLKPCHFKATSFIRSLTDICVFSLAEDRLDADTIQGAIVCKFV